MQSSPVPQRHGSIVRLLTVGEDIHKAPLKSMLLKATLGWYPRHTLGRSSVIECFLGFDPHFLLPTLHTEGTEQAGASLSSKVAQPSYMGCSLFTEKVSKFQGDLNFSKQEKRKYVLFLPYKVIIRLPTSQSLYSHLIWESQGKNSLILFLS